MGSLNGGPAVEKRYRKLVLGRQPVAHRDHRPARLLRDVRTDRVVGIDAAQRPASTVQVDQRGPRALTRWPIEPYGNSAQRKVTNRIDGGARSAELEKLRAHRTTPDVNGKLPAWRRARLRQLVQDSGNGGSYRHVQ